MKLYCQRFINWASHALGFGPGHTTLGKAGCYVSCLAMIAQAWLKATWRPPDLDEKFTAMKLYLGEGGGLFDLCSDNMLDRAFPGRFKTTSYSGYRADLIRVAVPSKDTFVVLHISSPTVPTHFVIAYSADGSLIADPWTGGVGRLSGYGGPARVNRTILVQGLPVSVAVVLPVGPPVVAPAPVAPPVAPAPTAPLPRPTPVPDAVLPSVPQNVLTAILLILQWLRGQTQP